MCKGMLCNKDQYKLTDHRFVCVYVDSFFKISVFVCQCPGRSEETYSTVLIGLAVPPRHTQNILASESAMTFCVPLYLGDEMCTTLLPVLHNF